MATTQSKQFDMSQLSWNAFTTKEMFSRRWYLRRERLIFFNLTMLIGMAAQGTATYCMFKYRFLRNHIEGATMHAAQVHNTDIEIATILGMTFPSLVPILFNAEYFILLFWPAQTYSARYLRVKKWIFVLATCAMLATVIYGTVVVATSSASITGVDDSTIQQLTQLYFRPPLMYNTWAQNIVWVVLLWIAVAFTVTSTSLLLKALPSQRHGAITPGLAETIPIATPIDGASADDTGSASEVKEKSLVSARTEEV